MIDTGYRLSLSLFYSFSEKKKDEPLLGWSYEAYLIIRERGMETGIQRKHKKRNQRPVS